MSHDAGNTPYFSIVIPTYNRATLIRRALDSCLRQDFGSFEIIVVDSASTDGTPEVVRGYSDPRIALISEQSRRGVCPARNLGVDSARADWLVFLDSDDELPPGALTLMRSKTLEVGDDIAHLRFMCQWDTGQQTPIPPLREEVWDYKGYIRFRERCIGGNTETMSCIRATTFQRVRFPEDRAYESLYHLDFALEFKTKAYTDILRIYHTDADNQNSYVPNPGHWLRAAPDVARSMDTIFVRHGDALRSWAPMTYLYEERTAAKYHYLAGHRLKATQYLLRYLRHKPFCKIGWAMFVFGIVGPKPLAWLEGVHMRLRYRWVSP